LASARCQWWQHNQQLTKSVGGYGNVNGNYDSNDNDDNKNKGNGGSLAAAQRDCGGCGSFTSARLRQRSGGGGNLRMCMVYH
jgi:hypothetical protein